MTRKQLILGSILTAVLGLSGCQSEQVKVMNNNQTVMVPRSPEKIVVMDFGALDTLDALGKGESVTGLPQSNLPNYLAQYNINEFFNTGKMKTPDLAAIRANQPSLIIINGRQNQSYAELSKIAPVILLGTDNNNYLGSVKQNITLLADITNTQSLAKQKIAALDKKIVAVQKQAEQSSVTAIVALHNNGKVMLANSGSYATLIHEGLGIKRAVPLNIPTTNSKPSPVLIDNTYIAEHKPSIIFIVDRSKAIGDTPLKSDFFQPKTLQQSGTKIVYLTADLWYLSGGGIESINQQIDEVSAALK